MANLILSTCLYILLLLHQSEQKVFLSTDDANRVIQRSKRANFMIFDEFWPGNLENECLEEICSYEEANEVFENKEKTDEFWNTYYGGRKCTSNPCQNHGECKDTIRSYVCNCPTEYHGGNCEFANNECYAIMNKGCQHFCNPNYGHDMYICACANGYTLGEDEKSCHPTDRFACGQQLAIDEKLTTHHSVDQISILPWEVVLLNSDREMFCSGVILSQSLVLTTAKCSKVNSTIFVYAAGAGTKSLKEGKQIIQVTQCRAHSRYDAKTGDNDLALLTLQENIQFNDQTLPICLPQKDFAEHVLLPSKAGILRSWKQYPSYDPLGRIPFQIPAVYRDNKICESTLNKTQTNRMFCTGSPGIFDSHVVDGGYSAVKHKGTWFLTGLMQGLNPAISRQNIFSLTKVSRYIMWLNEK